MNIAVKRASCAPEMKCSRLKTQEEYHDERFL
jgi:hypothetical protein